MCLNNKQKLSWISKTYKHYTNPLKNPKLTRVDVLIFVHLETGNKELKSGKDKDHSKNYQDGLTKDSYPSKPGLQSTHFKKYASLQTFVNSYYIASKPKSKQKSNRNIRFILTYNYYFHTQRVNTRSRTLFHNSQLQSHPSSASNHASQLSPGTIQGTQDMEIADITSEKRQASQRNSQPNKKPTPDATKGTSSSNLNLHDLWLGFQNMKMLAIDLSVEPYAYSLEACLQAGIPSEEACELVSAQIAFPRTLQQLWPFSCNDNVPGQQYHLIQIPFDVEIDSLTGYARTYQILLHFEKPLKPYTSKEIVELVTKRFQKMDIALGNILEPIAPLCSPKDSRPWNGMVKVHLKDPNKDAEALLTSKRVFAMEFDDCLRVPKISKSFDTPHQKSYL